ncbi:MAG: hypothetical protein JSW26_11895, partial [Desulfobacterales bacterium]
NQRPPAEPAASFNFGRPKNTLNAAAKIFNSHSVGSRCLMNGVINEMISSNANKPDIFYSS